MTTPRFIALLLALAALALPAQAQRVTVDVYVTNAPTYANTVTLNGDTRTWTTNAPSSTQQRISATNSIGATNLFNAILARPFSGNIVASMGVSNRVRLVGGSGQAMVASLPDTSWGYLVVSTNASGAAEANATQPWVTNYVAGATGAVASASSAAYLGKTSNAVSATYATTANTASNLAGVVAYASTANYASNLYGTIASATYATTANTASNVVAGVTNLLAAVTYVDAATASNDVYRIYFQFSGNQVTASNQWVGNPYGVGLASASAFMPIPSKYRYIRRAAIIMSGLERLDATNWPTPTVRFVKPDSYNVIDDGSAPYSETEHGTANNFGGSFMSWTNFPSVWQKTNFTSQSSRNGVILRTTNSVALPAAWWTNASGSFSGSFWLQKLILLNANTISMSNGVPPEAYMEFSTTP